MGGGARGRSVCRRHGESLMDRHPLVSVCIPSYNHERFLPTAIESVLNQTYRSIELIIVDDGSNDGSLAIAKSYASLHPETVRIFTHPGHERRGISATANLAFQHSSGDYWCGLSSDDAFYPDKIRRQLTYMETHPDVGLSYGPVTEIDARGTLLGTYPTRDLSRDRNPVASLLEGNKIHAQTVMVRREHLNRVGLHDEDLVYSDWELWIRVLARSRVAFIDGPLASYRIHETNTSLRVAPEIQRARHMAVMLAVQRKADQVGGALAADSNKALVQLQIAFLRFCGGDTVEARNALREAHRLSPSLCANTIFLGGWLARRHRELAVFMQDPADDLIAWFTTEISRLPGSSLLPARLRRTSLSAMTVTGLRLWNLFSGRRFQRGQ